MGKSNGKVCYDKEEKSGEVKRLKGQIRSLEHENKRLKGELRTYEKAMAKSVTFLKEKSKELTLEELIDGANEDMTLQQITDNKNEKFEDLQRKWKCHVCSQGIMKFISIPKGDKTYYFRKCSISICKNRTETKELIGEVDKGLL